MSLYQHANIRDEQAEAFKMKLETRRHQRLIVAIQANQARELKLQKLDAKLADKYQKLVNKNATLLAQIDAKLDELENNIVKMQTISSEKTLIETETGG